jgi:hypothetical protein
LQKVSYGVRKAEVQYMLCTCMSMGPPVSHTKEFPALHTKQFEVNKKYINGKIRSLFKSVPGSYAVKTGSHIHTSSFS